MRDLFLNLKSQGVSIFLNSHLLSEVEMISDRVAILNKGALIKVGTLDEVRGGTTSHRIQIAGLLSPEQIKTIGLESPFIQSDETTTTISVTTDAELNQTIDLLRSWGIMIRSVAQQKSSLEDSFIKLVTNGNPV
jgi:ABC-2 type transport system ATP-binding protein